MSELKISIQVRSVNLLILNIVCDYKSANLHRFQCHIPIVQRTHDLVGRKIHLYNINYHDTDKQILINNKVDISLQPIILF